MKKLGGQGGSLHKSLIESGLFSSLLLKGKVGREEGGELAGAVPFLPALPAYQEQGGKVSLS